MSGERSEPPGSKATRTELHITHSAQDVLKVELLYFVFESEFMWNIQTLAVRECHNTQEVLDAVSDLMREHDAPLDSRLLPKNGDRVPLD